MDFVFLNNTETQWLWAFLYLVIAFIVSKIVSLVITKVFDRIAQKTDTRIDDIIINAIKTPISIIIILIGLKLSLHELTVAEKYATMVDKAYMLLIIINITWIISRFLSAFVEEIILDRSNQEGSRISAMVIPTLQRFIQILIWGFGIVVALTNIGYDVGALVAGLGIGGLALALAAKDTVTNFFGGITIFFDKPFRIGDRVRVAGFDGYIMTIGLRSFRLATLDGTEVVIPNSTIIDSVVENVTREPSRRIILNLGLTYDTSPEQMKRAIDILKAIVDENVNVEDQKDVFFCDFGDFSLNIRLIYYIRKGSSIPNTRSEICLTILEKFNAEGLNFAFPTQSLYIEKSDNQEKVS